MQLELIGSHPLECNAGGRLKTCIGTAFPDHQVLFTQPPAVHAWQRVSFIDLLNTRRKDAGQASLSPEEEENISLNSVDLIFEPDHILIRPDPQRMDLAFAADEMLQGLVSKRQIKFLSVSDGRVRESIKRRGEAWRLCSIPKTWEARERLVSSSKVAIDGQPLYYYNRLTGTRWLTFSEFDGLSRLDEGPLAAHLREIARHANLQNRRGRPELDFFAADIRRFGASELSGVDFEHLAPAELRAKFTELRDHFRSAVHEAYRKDDAKDRNWCKRMVTTLFLEGNEVETEQILSGLSPEFFLQIEWLPGGRFEEGEFIFDSLFDEAAAHPDDQELQRLCDPRTKGIICNLIREYGDLDYINIGCLPESLSLARPRSGRRGVFILEFHPSRDPEPVRRFLRLQKWGVWEHLDEGKDLLRAIRESDEYTDYWLDRRLGCRQLGMNLTRRVSMRQLLETYRGSNPAYQGEQIRTTYFERDYLPGIATDKLPLERYAKPGYAICFARLLGRAAASSMIVGRSLELGTHPVFDDGDEVLLEDQAGFPGEILVGDHTGSFGEYKQPLSEFAAYYARPVNSRANVVPNPQLFAYAYLNAFRERFAQIQGDYRKRPRAFDTLFKHCKYDTAGSFAYRWECVLRRLQETDVDALVEAIRLQISVVRSRPPQFATAK